MASDAEAPAHWSEAGVSVVAKYAGLFTAHEEEATKVPST